MITGTFSPMILRPRNTKITKKKKLSPRILKKKISSNSSIKEISKQSFLAAALNYIAAIPHGGGATKYSPELQKTTSNSIIEITKESFNSSVKTHGEKSSAWIKTEFLGKGSYGSVYLVQNKKDKTLRAIKTTEISCASSLMYEFKILYYLDSPFIIKCYGDEIVNEQYNLILEYCSGKTIADLIEKNQDGLLESDVKLFAKDILSGLKYLHDGYIVHCDIKPDNLLLCPTDLRLRPNGYLTKIGDFGLALQKGSIEYGDGSG